MIIRTRAISYNMRERTFWTLAILVVALVGTYIYAVSSTIKNVSERQELERSIATLIAEQSELEFAYIEKREGISNAVALSQGFERITEAVYISRTGPGALSLNTEGSQ